MQSFKILHRLPESGLVLGEKREKKKKVKNRSKESGWFEAISRGC